MYGGFRARVVLTGAWASSAGCSCVGCDLPWCVSERRVVTAQAMITSPRSWVRPCFQPASETFPSCGQRWYSVRRDHVPSFRLRRPVRLQHGLGSATSCTCCGTYTTITTP